MRLERDGSEHKPHTWQLMLDEGDEGLVTIVGHDYTEGGVESSRERLVRSLRVMLELAERGEFEDLASE